MKYLLLKYKYLIAFFVAAMALFAATSYSTSTNVHDIRITNDGALAAQIRGSETQYYPNTGTCTASEAVCSGSYTPTCSNVTNMSSATCDTARYFKLGNVVLVSGHVSNITTTSTGLTKFYTTIPIAVSSNFSVVGALNGTAAGDHGSNDYQLWRIFPNTSSSSQASFQTETTVAITNEDISYVYTYTIY